jgi:hypothetical protein
MVTVARLSNLKPGVSFLIFFGAGFGAGASPTGGIVGVGVVVG